MSKRSQCDEARFLKDVFGALMRIASCANVDVQHVDKE